MTISFEIDESLVERVAKDCDRTFDDTVNMITAYYKEYEEQPSLFEEECTLVILNV